MRIALMTNNYKPFMGGVPISVERLAKGLEILGHQVTIFAPTYQEQEEEENVFRYATLMKRFVGEIVLPNPFDMRIEKEFQKNPYDVIHVHHPMLIGRNAKWLSKKYHICNYFAAADAFLFASKTETQGIVVLEAFAGGTPVLAVRASGVEDLVTSGVNGVLIEEDVAEYAAVLSEFFSGKYDRKSMEANAYQTGLCYREEAVAKEVERIYNEVVKEKHMVSKVARVGV